jgi:uncharacterized protein
VPRHDFQFPFVINAASGQAARAVYADHVEQMIRQVLLTDPGERINRPDFGCGLRRLVFAPHSEALTATTRLLIQQSLNRWLADQIELQTITVSQPGTVPDGELRILIEYILIETQSLQRTEIRVQTFGTTP